MHELLPPPLPAADAGFLDLGFRRETFADDPPAASGTQGTDVPVYGPEDVPADGPVFKAFRSSEEGQRATAQMTRCIDTIARFAGDRGKPKVAENILLLHGVLKKDNPADLMHFPYLPHLYTHGKRSLEQIAAMLGRLEARGDHREHEALRGLQELGDGMHRCGRRMDTELKAAEDWLRPLGDGLKNTVRDLCQNTARVAIMDTLVLSGTNTATYLRDPHVRPRFEAQVGLPWVPLPGADPHFHKPGDFDQRIQECRAAVRRSVTPPAIARQLARDCLHEVRTALGAGNGGATTLDHEDLLALKAAVNKASQRCGQLQERRFVHGDGFSEPMTMTEDPLAILSNIRKNLVTWQLVGKKDDVTLWKEDVDGAPWKLVLIHGDHPAVIEGDDEDACERSALPADWRRVLLRLASSGALDAPVAGPLADPEIRRRMIDGVIDAQTTPPATWDTAVLALPGLLSQVCASLEDEAVVRLLGDVAGRPDAAGTGLFHLALELAMQRQLAAATQESLDAMDPADLRAAWPWILPHLGEALQAANDTLADTGLAALDRFRPAEDGIRWTQCRKALHDFRRSMQTWSRGPLAATTPLPPWPDVALRRMGLLHREGLLSGPMIVTLLKVDTMLGVFLDNTGRRTDPEHLRRFLDDLAGAAKALALSQEDMRSLLRPVRDVRADLGNLELTSPLCSAMMQGQPAHVDVFFSWMLRHAGAPWMPDIQGMALPDEVLVPAVKPSAVIAPAFKAYLDGLAALHQAGHLAPSALAPLIHEAPDAEPGDLPTGPGLMLIRKVLLADGRQGPCAAVLQAWRDGDGRHLAIAPLLSDAATPDSSLASSPGPAVRSLASEPTVPRFWRLPPAPLEEALVHLGRHGYLTVDDLVVLLSSCMDEEDRSSFGPERSLRVIKQLSLAGVFPLRECETLLSDPSSSTDWRAIALRTDNLPVLHAYFDLVEHLADKHAGLVDVDSLLHVRTDEGPVTMSVYGPQVMGGIPSSFNVVLDAALKARQRGWITPEQLSNHLATRRPVSGISILPVLLGVEQDESTLLERHRTIMDGHLRKWLERLGIAAREHLLSGAQAVELLMERQGPQRETPMSMAMTRGSARRLSLLFDWLVTATATDSVLTRLLARLVRGRGKVQEPGDVQEGSVAFEALQLGRVETLTAWLDGIRRLREAGRLTNGDYVALLAPEEAGDRRAIAAASGDPRARACAALLREAALDGQSRGWIDADGLQDILDPLVEAGLID